MDAYSPIRKSFDNTVLQSIQPNEDPMLLFSGPRTNRLCNVIVSRIGDTNLGPRRQKLISLVQSFTT